MAGKKCAYFVAVTIATYLLTTTTALSLPQVRPSYNQDLVSHTKVSAPNPDPCLKVKSSCPVPEKENATLLPNPDDCTSYCACVWGNPEWMPCPDGLHFNPTLHVCDYPSRAGCEGVAPTAKPTTVTPTPTENITAPAVSTTNAGHENHDCLKVKSQCPVPERENATLLPNPDDCGSYCVCVWGTPVWMPCPPGLHFNPTLNVCDHPSHAGCGTVPNTPTEEPVPSTSAPETTTNGSSGHVDDSCKKVQSNCPVPERANATLLPNPDDCGSYCACVWGTPVLMHCPIGLHFNPSLNVCDIPGHAGCGSVPNPPTNDPLTTTSAPEMTTKGSGGHADHDCLKVKSQCPVPEKENATLLPNPDDCGSYCVCVWGTPVRMPCPPGLHFNPTLNVCDHPSHAGCGSLPHPITNLPATTKAPPAEEVSSTEASMTTAGPIRNGCPKVKTQCPVPEKENATLLPNPDDCGSYCVCVLGNPIYMSCPPGLNFNPTLNVCDYPSHAGCGTVPNTPTEEPVPSTSAPETTTNSSNSHVDDSCQKVKSKCPVPESANATLLPNPDDCGSYCECVWGTPVLMHCPIGLHFNPSLNVCDIPGHAGCGSVPNPPTGNPTTVTPHPTENVTATEVTTTANHGDNGCYKVTSQCPVPEKENATLLPNPDDCGSYCACVWGVPVWMPCPAGLHFNPTLHVCDYPKDAGCGAAPAPPSGKPTPGPTHTPTWSDNTSPTSGHGNNGCFKVKPSCPVPEKVNATLLPNPDDCGSYCACVWGNPIWMPCPVGLHFNPTLHVCDYPYEAGCLSEATTISIPA
ncbi:hypothetical protein J437_LFUL009232 [Ladona fulva]|uniref:Chitin-binding type-2 domain-containing protein n=1 Tax=Ladona fulva TaxID=123851 RepID=A0A8K0P140_LADFU|nr:hypothetical protein J437_LFUL009232 [Ladona fulva]